MERRYALMLNAVFVALLYGTLMPLLFFVLTFCLFA